MCTSGFFSFCRLFFCLLWQSSKTYTVGILATVERLQGNTKTTTFPQFWHKALFLYNYERGSSEFRNVFENKIPLSEIQLEPVRSSEKI